MPTPPPAVAGINALLEGLDADDIARVRARLQPMTLAAGEHVFREGDVADSVYLVVRGSVSIVATRGDSPPGTRYASLSPGTLFGEAAVLDGGGRSADAVADTEAELLRLDQTALIELARAHPELGTRLYRNMARYLAQRLRIASAAWASAAG
ncbi:MAG: cyclic nucleotide-binding domain-containing protein [Chitinophagaceae bacterium]|nr:cyclic nucleotide-binding domain-containing protein [Rubrivivax sp.]